jgi:hypothetical protein
VAAAPKDRNRLRVTLFIEFSRLCRDRIELIRNGKIQGSGQHFAAPLLRRKHEKSVMDSTLLNLKSALSEADANSSRSWKLTHVE